MSPLILVFAIFVIALCVAVGCAESGSSSKGSAKTSHKSRASVTLRVLVVNEPELVEAINRLRGDWESQGSGPMSATAASWGDLANAKSIDADVVVFPSRYLGELSLRGLLRPVRTNILESEEFKANDLFPLVRQELIRWGGAVMALPLGVHIATAADAKEGLALSLLAQAAPRVVSPDRVDILFDADTMKPRIAEPEFVEALAELVAIRKSPSQNADAGADKSAAANEPQAKSGNDRRRSSVPVIGYDDRLAGVTSSTRNAASAFRLLKWLARPETSSRLAGRGDRHSPVRRSLASSAKWYGDELTVEQRSERSRLLDEQLGGEWCLLIPRIPGIDEYLAVLDEAVNATANGDVEGKAALAKAAQRWDEITDSRGRELQREAYLKHLGVD
jgi:ABC-type glycerol-3-phosphate transport system substrate-binding protein